MPAVYRYVRGRQAGLEFLNCLQRRGVMAREAQVLAASVCGVWVANLYPNSRSDRLSSSVMQTVDDSTYDVKLGWNSGKLALVRKSNSKYARSEY